MIVDWPRVEAAAPGDREELADRCRLRRGVQRRPFRAWLVVARAAGRGLVRQVCLAEHVRLIQAALLGRSPLGPHARLRRAESARGTGPVQRRAVLAQSGGHHRGRFGAPGAAVHLGRGPVAVVSARSCAADRRMVAAGGTPPGSFARAVHPARRGAQRTDHDLRIVCRPPHRLGRGGHGGRAPRPSIAQVTPLAKARPAYPCHAPRRTWAYSSATCP